MPYQGEFHFFVAISTVFFDLFTHCLLFMDILTSSSMKLKIDASFAVTSTDNLCCGKMGVLFGGKLYGGNFQHVLIGVYWSPMWNMDWVV